MSASHAPGDPPEDASKDTPQQAAPDAPHSPGSPWLVACLCAAWCRTCETYDTTFAQLASEFGTRARFVNVDIEDHEDALGDLDVVDFPTLLIAEGETVYFLGPVLPHLETARQLIERALRRELAEVKGAGVVGLAGRVAALSSSIGS
jgi:thiol-disulfide isomerase/thioredoxin